LRLPTRSAYVYLLVSIASDSGLPDSFGLLEAGLRSTPGARLLGGADRVAPVQGREQGSQGRE